MDAIDLLIFDKSNAFQGMAKVVTISRIQLAVGVINTLSIQPWFKKPGTKVKQTFELNKRLINF